jgi:Fic family protein
MILLSSRQKRILLFIQKNGSASNREIRATLKNAARVTIVRDLDVLLKNKLIKKTGKGRGVTYSENALNELHRYIDIRNYFRKGPDSRHGTHTRFNAEIFTMLEHVFQQKEIKQLTAQNSIYQKRIKTLPPTIISKEFERLSIDLSWKSSQIEGNTYTLLETEALIKENKHAPGHSKDEGTMILNHKKALDYILDKRTDFRKLTQRKIENLHALLVTDLGVSTGIRTKPVGITGTFFLPLDNEHQITEAMDVLIQSIHRSKDPFSRALIGIIVLSYIQPFEDGNKRTSRLLGNALLIANGACPLSFRSVNEVDYKKALILFYEQNNITFFKDLFIEQFNFAVENYFLA